MTNGTLTRPASAGDQPTMSPQPVSFFGPYLGYVGYFVGAGLISGGIVHYPLDPGRYALITAAGVVVFLAATFLNEVVVDRRRIRRVSLVRVLAASLVLSLGIGMLSGGIQHFMDFPSRSAILVPSGLALSFLAYAVRQGVSPVKIARRPAAVLFAGLTLATLVALHHVAEAAERSGGGDHDHGAKPTPVETGSPRHDEPAHNGTVREQRRGPEPHPNREEPAAHGDEGAHDAPAEPPGHAVHEDGLGH